MTTAPEFDPDQLKARTRSLWDAYATGWASSAPVIRNWLAPATKAMIEMAGIAPGAHVLDVAAGAGDQTLDIARCVGPAGYILATDLSPAILALAQENVRRAGLRNVETRVADCETLCAGDAAFDAAVCRLGLMFCPTPVSALRQIHRALKVGGRLCTMVFSSPERNPCISTLMSTAIKHAGLPPRDPYQPGGLLSLGKPGLVDRLFGEAGFTAIATTKVDAPFQLVSVDDYLAFIQNSASPILELLARLDNERRQTAWSEIRDRLLAFQNPKGWTGPNELLLTVGQK